VTQIHSADYRNPSQLTEGAVLVVGAGSSGGQIADELQRSGRKVYLCVGPHDRPPRAYRGRDYCWWLGVLGLWDVAAKAPGTEHVTISVSGVRGGETVDFRRLAHAGMTLLGRASGYRDGKLLVDDDLGENIAAGDANYLDMLRQADAYIERFGLDLPIEPEAHVLPDDPDYTGFFLDRFTKRLRREGYALSPTRRFARTRALFFGSSVAIATRIYVHLGCLARRITCRRSDRNPTQLPKI